MKKTSFFIEQQGLKITDLIIFLDISDVKDEVIYKSIENTVVPKKI